MTNQRTFRPTIQDDGAVRAGGLELFRVDPLTGQLVRRDRYLRRCHERGTEDVRVELLELVQEIVRFIETRT